MKLLIRFFTHLCEQYLPDAFGFCLILTMFVYCAAFLVTPHGAFEIVQFWGDSLWTLNGFAFQMAMVLMSGHMLAQAPVVNRRLEALARLPKTNGGALVLLSLVSLSACWLNWGFGLIVAALMARALAARFPNSSFGLMLATGYAGFVVWHGGLSGSIPLSIAGEDKIMMALGLNSVPLSETLFSETNVFIVLALFILMPAVAWFLKDTPGSAKVAPEVDNPPTVTRAAGLRGWIEHSRVPMYVLILFGALYLVQLIRLGKSPDINFVNLTFLVASALLLGSMSKFLAALNTAVKNVGGILIQFPMYAGIMGIMQHSGLGDQISQLFVQFASAETLPVLSFLSAGVVNFFVPSGGGQWVVQGPIILKAAQELGVPTAKAAMAIAWGDAWTNLVQPFWALPLLALAKLELKDIMGPCVIYLWVSGIVISLGLYLL